MTTANDHMTSHEFELPPDNVPRFAFEVAEAILDRFAQSQDDAYRRAWQKAKFTAAAYAYADFWDDWQDDLPMHPALAVARGWEELQIGFTGRGETCVTGAIWQLWETVVEESEASFVDAVRKAWAAAEQATPRNAVRLYRKRDRMAEPFRFLDQPWSPNVLMPNPKATLRCWWQKDEENDVTEQDDMSEQLESIERADRDTCAVDTLMHWGEPVEA